MRSISPSEKVAAERHRALTRFTEGGITRLTNTEPRR
jgi:hypothetical protein